MFSERVGPFTRTGERGRINPIDLHGDRHGQHPLAIFVSQFDCDLTGRVAGVSSAAPRLFWVAARWSGTRSRVNSCRTARKATTASSNCAVPLSLAKGLERGPEVVLGHRPLEWHALADALLQGRPVGHGAGILFIA